MRVILVNEDRLYFINLIKLQVSVIFFSPTSSVQFCSVCLQGIHRTHIHSIDRLEIQNIRNMLYELHINHSIVFNVKWIIAYNEQHWLKTQSTRRQKRDRVWRRVPERRKKHGSRSKNEFYLYYAVNVITSHTFLGSVVRLVALNGHAITNQQMKTKRQKIAFKIKQIKWKKNNNVQQSLINPIAN